MLSQIKACINDGQIGEAIHLLHEYHEQNGAITDIMSVADDDEIQLLLDSWREIICALESHLETISYTWDRTETTETTTTAIVDEILGCISQLYKTVATISSKYRDVLQFNDVEFESDEQAIAECYLDWAIAAKRAGVMKECLNANIKRMRELPELVQTDAVRLLGIHSKEEVDDGNVTIEEITKKGLFETQLVSRGNDDCSYDAHIPTENAIHLGKRAAKIFAHANYTLQTCTEILQYALSSHDNECSSKFNPKGIYSANSFFNHRREVFSIRNDLKCKNDIKVLALLFLFGVSLKETEVETALGHENVQLLFESGLLTRNQVDNTMVLGEVQIYPLSSDTFEGKGKHRSRPVYIMTDWSLESLRLPKNAIMSIGYDSLELVALAAGVDVFSPTITSSNNSRVLDLCCGCGIQGIYSAKRSKIWTDSSVRCELISMDINPRACHFVCANAVLNELVSDENTIYSIEADLFSPVQLHQEIEGVQSDNLIGRVDMILSNPPFVAVPFANNPRLDSALYAAGGGHDGMHLVREIVNKSFMYLSDGKGRPQLLMVTELPNVETSCNLLETFFDDPKGVQINVAYIEDDVEHMEVYAKEREEEAGQQVIGRDWNPTTGVIKNRALVLISISKDVKCDTTKHGLFCFNEKAADNSMSLCDADEEDQFLTPKGIRFARKHLQIMPNKSAQMSKQAKTNKLQQVEQLEHDALLPYISVDSPFSRHIKEQIEVEGYVVIPNVLSREECEVELSRLWDFVEATSPGICRDDPNSWYPTPCNASIAQEEGGSGTTPQSPDPWPHSGWGFLPDMCQSFGAGWLFGELREKLADRVFEPLFGTSELHSSKEGFTFHRPTAPGVASNGAVHPFIGRERPRVAGKVQTKGMGEHFDQCSAHTGLQCIQSSTAFIDQDLDGADGCFQCWPRSHVEHPRMTKDIWRGRSDWVPLTDEELISLEERGLSARKVPVRAGDVILWRSDLVHCGVGPSLPRTGFRAVSYTAMIPAIMTPAHVLTEKIEHYHSMQTGDHRPNVTSRHFSAPKKTEKKHKKSSHQESDSQVRRSYFTDGQPLLTLRQAELYGLLPYNRDANLDVDEFLKSLGVRVAH